MLHGDRQRAHGHGPRGEDGDETAMERQRGTSRFRQAWDFEIQATGSALAARKEREAARMAPVPYRLASRLDSLAVTDAPAVAGGGADLPPMWPHPATGAALEAVCAAIRETPGMSGNAVAKAARLGRETTSIAILKAAEVGLIVNTGKSGSPKWTRAPWLDEFIERYG